MLPLGAVFLLVIWSFTPFLLSVHFFAILLGLCKLLFLVVGFFVFKELERVYPSLMWVEYVYRKHPLFLWDANTNASHWHHQHYSNAVGSCIPFVIKSFYSWLCNEGKKNLQKSIIYLSSNVQYLFLNLGVLCVRAN